MSTRRVHVGRKMRFYPTRTQEKLLRQNLGCARLVYNLFLAQRSTVYEETGKGLSYTQCSQALTQLKRQDEYSFLTQASSTVLQQSLRNLDAAFTRFFKGEAEHPEFHRKHGANSMTFTTGAFQLDGKVLTLQKIPGHLRIRWSYTLPTSFTPSKVTVSLEPCGAWYVSVQGTQEIDTLPETDRRVGIDVGIRSYATFNNGEKISNPRFAKQSESKLTRLQRQLDRQKKGGVKYRRTQRKIARVHAHTRHQRQDFIHKLTTRIVRENQTIICESLDIQALLQRLEPKQDEHDKYMKNGQSQHSKLAKSIQDASWYEYFRQLKYKSQWYGREFIQVPQDFPSTRMCSQCLQVTGSDSLNIRSWVCSNCNTRHDRDINAAVNIKREGLELLRTEGRSGIAS